MIFFGERTNLFQRLFSASAFFASLLLLGRDQKSCFFAQNFLPKKIAQKFSLDLSYRRYFSITRAHKYTRGRKLFSFYIAVVV